MKSSYRIFECSRGDRRSPSVFCGRFVNRPYDYRSLRAGAHTGAPQGGLSCPFGAIHLLAIPYGYASHHRPPPCHCEAQRAVAISWYGLNDGNAPKSIGNAILHCPFIAHVTNAHILPGDCHVGHSPPRNDTKFFEFRVDEPSMIAPTMGAKFCIFSCRMRPFILHFVPQTHPLGEDRKTYIKCVQKDN